MSKLPTNPLNTRKALMLRKRQNNGLIKVDEEKLAQLSEKHESYIRNQAKVNKQEVVEETDDFILDRRAQSSFKKPRFSQQIKPEVVHGHPAQNHVRTVPKPEKIAHKEPPKRTGTSRVSMGKSKIPFLDDLTENLPSTSASILTSSTFYNEALQSEVVLREDVIPDAIFADFYTMEDHKSEAMIERLVKDFKDDLARAKKDKLRFWFILERPFHGSDDETFKKGSALISRLPINFRISLLPLVLDRLNLKYSGIAYISLNVAFNWVTQLDTEGLVVGEVYRKFFDSLMTFSKSASIKKFVVLTFPYKSAYGHSAEFVKKEIFKCIVEANKKFKSKSSLFSMVDYNNLLKSNDLKHGNEAFRKTLSLVNKAFFSNTNASLFS